MNSLPKNVVHPIVIFRDHCCDVKTEDGKHIFVAKLGEDDINKDPGKLYEFLSYFPKLNEKEFLATGDGVYTWIIYSEPDSTDIKFLCNEVVSPFELGTRHQALVFDKRHNVDKIYGGGEIWKHDGVIEYNLRSGTYSYPLVKFNFKKIKTKPIETAFLKFFPDAVRGDDEDGYMYKIKIVKKDILDLYRKFGYIVLYFDDYNTCAKFNNDFGRFDWSIEYNKKQIAEATLKNDFLKIKIHNDMLVDSLKRMIELLEPYMKKPTQNAGTRRKYRKNRKTRRTRKH